MGNKGDVIYRQAAIGCLCNGQCGFEGRWCDDGDCAPVRRIKGLPCAQAVEGVSKKAVMDAIAEYAQRLKDDKYYAGSRVAKECLRMVAEMKGEANV